MYNYGRYFSGNSYEYKKNGLLKSETYYKSKKRFDGKYIYEYNIDNNIMKVIEVNKRGKHKSVEIYEYE